ncbi:unnamed protein product [Caenorhabditis angaria]|uniref:Uncharacterized protein n=1 Tax=Caenorhabditis angaria TaxID=860376 RepID=A0A9P1IN43_9PELO|nr:unnamed protein product [Caenorhabditis angaria]
MMLLFKISVLVTFISSPALACLPGLGGLGLGGGGGGACCAPPPVSAPALAYQAPPPAPLPNAYIAPPQAPAGGFYGSAAPFNVAPATYAQQPAQQIGAGGAYADVPNRFAGQPLQQQQPAAAIPLLGQPVGASPYAEAPVQQVIQAAIEPQAVNVQPIAATSEVISKVLPASAVLEEHIVQPAEVSQNNVVSSIQTGYGDEQAVKSSSSSSSESAEHQSTHQVQVESASNSVEQQVRVIPEQHVVAEIVPEVVQTTAAPAIVVETKVQHYEIPQTPAHVQVPVVPAQTYQQQVNKEQATVNELLATLDTVTVTPAPVAQGNLDFHQVTVEPQQPQVHQEVIIETEAGSDYDTPSVPAQLNEDRKDVPSVQPIQPYQPSVPQPHVPEQLPQIIPQPEVHLQPVPTAGFVAPETYTVAPVVVAETYTVAPVVIAETYTAAPVVPVAVSQTYTVAPIVVAETYSAPPVVAVQSTAAPEQQVFENITAEGSVVTTPAAPAVTENVGGAEYDENIIVSTSQPEEVEPAVQEYGSKFQKVAKGAETVVTEPIEIAPYGRFIL